LTAANKNTINEGRWDHLKVNRKSEPEIEYLMIPMKTFYASVSFLSKFEKRLAVKACNSTT